MAQFFRYECACFSFGKGDAPASAIMAAVIDMAFLPFAGERTLAALAFDQTAQQKFVLFDARIDATGHDSLHPVEHCF